MRGEGLPGRRFPSHQRLGEPCGQGVGGRPGGRSSGGEHRMRPVAGATSGAVGVPFACRACAGPVVVSAGTSSVCSGGGGAVGPTADR